MEEEAGEAGRGLDGGGLDLGARLRSWVLRSGQWEPWKAFELGRDMNRSALRGHCGTMGRMKFSERRDQDREGATALGLQ